jgi:Arc/MetJ-type ribon-helix-helix transcriptional regulator
MAITLDADLEQRIQRQLDHGAFREPAELLAHALDLVEAEAMQEDWLVRNKEAINADLDESFAQAARGEGYSPEESRALLDRHRSSRVA